MTTIALVDDENSIRTSVSLALESEGFKVDVFQNGIEALEALESKTYDLGLFDIKMPKMDGNELLAKVRSSKKDDLKELPIIFLTSKDQEFNRELQHNDTSTTVASNTDGSDTATTTPTNKDQLEIGSPDITKKKGPTNPIERTPAGLLTPADDCAKCDDEEKIFATMKYRLDRDHIMMVRKLHAELVKRNSKHLESLTSDQKAQVKNALARGKKCDDLQASFKLPEWKLVNDKKEVGIKSWHRKVGEVHALRVEGEIDAPLSMVLTLLFEADLYHKWIPSFKMFGHENSRKIYSPPENPKQFLMSSLYRLVWPMSNREAVMACEGVDSMDELAPMVVVLMETPGKEGYPGCEIPPAARKTTRAELLPCGFTLEPVEGAPWRTKCCTSLAIDPKMTVPDWLSTLVVKGFACMFLEQLRKAVEIVKTDEDYHAVMSSDHPFYNWFRGRVDEVWPEQPMPKLGAKYAFFNFLQFHHFMVLNSSFCILIISNVLTSQFHRSASTQVCAAEKCQEVSEGVRCISFAKC